MSRLLLPCIYFCAFFIAALAGWVGRTFGDPTVAQVVFHLYYADTAAFRMGEVYVVTFLTEAVALPLLLAAAATWLHRQAARRWQGPRLRVLGAVPAVALAVGASLLLLQFSVFSFVAAHVGPDRFAAAYRAPQQVQLQPGRLRNLVLVYVESLETTYAAAELFGSNLLAPLDELGGHRFAAYRQAPGATWTIAAMVATQCGVPLSIYSSEDMRAGGQRRAFLPGATCLGDVLQAHGYRNVFMGGAPLSFAGKGTFLRDHGYVERHGKEEWLAAGAVRRDFGGWGLHDDALLARASARLAQLQAAGQPFNLTLLTLDTHNPEGFTSATCSGQGVRNFADRVACTSRLVADFVRTAGEQGLLENTVVVILGDHLAVGNPVQRLLLEEPDRQLVNLFIGAEPPPGHRQELLPFDLFPSLLDAVGIEVAGGRLGLGVSGWVDPLPADLPQDLQNLHLPTLSASAAYLRLWRAP
jgi:phosphoglycerol transferase